MSSLNQYMKNSISTILMLFALNACGGGSGGNDLPESDSTPPQVVFVTPLDNQKDVNTSQLIRISLNEAVINDNTINILVEQVDNLDNFITSVAMKDVVDYNDKTFTLTFSPVDAFIERLRYRVTISNIKDTTKNVLSTQVWYFSTKTPPVLESIKPRNLDNPISRGIKTIRLVFSESMDEVSLKAGIKLTKLGSNSEVPVSITYSNESITTVKGQAILTLPANTLLDASSEYQLTILPTVQDLNGISISLDSLPIIKTFFTGVTSTVGQGERPASPTNPNATLVIDSPIITINWDGVVGSTNYNVYVSKNDAPFLFLASVTPPAALTYEHTATLSDSYVYGITAENANGESKFALTLQVSPSTNLTPVDFSASAGDATVTLTWSSKANLVYKLEYLDNTNRYTELASATSPYSHQGLTNGDKYEYRLTATDPNTNKFGDSVKTATPLAAIKFGPGATITAIAGDASIRLEWPDVSSNANFSYYTLYELDSPSTRANKCKLLATNINSSGGTTIVFTHDNNTVDACSKTARPVVNGELYSYSVAVVNKNGSEGAIISSISVTPIITPAAPIIIGAIPGNGSIEVQWQALNGLVYNVYQNGQLMTPAALKFTGVTASHTILGLTNNTLYQFEIEAVNANNLASIKTSISKAPLPTIDVGSFIVEPFDNKVKLTWTTNTLVNSTTNTAFNFNVFVKKGTAAFIKSTAPVTLVAGALNTYETVMTRLMNNLPHQFEVSVITSPDLNESVVTSSAVYYPRQGGRKIASSLEDFNYEGTQIFLSSAHVCSIRNGNIWCWGDNYNGQLGNGTESFAEKPVKVTNIVASPNNNILTPTIFSDWESVSAGQGFSCGIRNNVAINLNELYCWGKNTSGVLGINNTSPFNFITPQLVTKPQAGQWKTISSNKNHSCAILETLVNEKLLYCWGKNSNGQLGDSSITTLGVNKPNLVIGAQGGAAFVDWLEVSVGDTYTCGIRANGFNQTSLWCWGKNDSSQLGDGGTATTNALTPIKVVNSFLDWTSISAGSRQTCAVRTENNSLYCWGLLSNGFSITDVNSNVPILASNPTNDWLKVFTGDRVTCGLKLNGTRACWGANDQGNLGDGSFVFSTEIKVTSSNNAWNEFVFSTKSVCGLQNTRDVACWGNAYGHKLGDFTSEISWPTFTAHGADNGINNPTFNQFISIVTSKGQGRETYALNGNVAANILYGWGTFRYGPGGITKSTGAVRVNSSSWKEISQGARNTCAILSTDDTLWCWGSNFRNSISIIASTISTPTKIGTDKWRHVSLGVEHTCGITLSTDPVIDKQVWCWGNNFWGGLGRVDGYGSFSGQPAASVSKTDVKWLNVYAGNQRTCAISESNRLYCWGRNEYGAVGNGVSTSDSAFQNKTAVPTEVVQPNINPSISSTTLWRKVSVAEENICGITLDGNGLHCWGSGFTYILGNASKRNGSTEHSAIPISLKDINGNVEVGPWIDVSVGTEHACALKSDNTLWCWGHNSVGQLGRGKFEISSVADYSLTSKLVQVGINTKYKSVASGPFYTCAITSSTLPDKDNTIECWGNNHDGQTGLFGAWRTNPLSVNFQ